MLPVGQIILVKAAGPRALPRLMSMIGVPIILAPVFGPTIGGLLIEHAGWEWIFFVNIPIGIVAVALGRRLLPADEPEHAGKLDALGLALIATGLVGVTYGLAETGTTGTIASPHVLVPLIGGIALVATFLIRSLRIPEPLLDIRLFSNRAFAAAAFTTFCLGAALFGAMILMPLYFQTVRGAGRRAHRPAAHAAGRRCRVRDGALRPRDRARRRRHHRARSGSSSRRSPRCRSSSSAPRRPTGSSARR